MRITENTNMDARAISNPVSNNAPTIERVVKQGSETTGKIPISTVEQAQQLDNSEETKTKVQDAVNKMNEMLEVNNSASRFMYHEGLERYYVTVVDRETEEVVKEIPPKKLLDAFYEMQKMLGMIVDEKI
ncbi:flagellar protein FlaG [Lysinibacillus sp. 54212]|uniref:flagellar protein FlaG n=1 Tax=Lysinibacillus sp. 54212 TaxID=3119829 RepID=UPI002FC81FCC